jgi:hypothetical protein
MRVIQEIKVECATQQEEDALIEWVEHQCHCTVEFNVIARRSEGITYSMTPYFGSDAPDASTRFEVFCAELRKFVKV